MHLDILFSNSIEGRKERIKEAKWDKICTRSFDITFPLSRTGISFTINLHFSISRFLDFIHSDRFTLIAEFRDRSSNDLIKSSVSLKHRAKRIGGSNRRDSAQQSYSSRSKLKVNS